MSKFGPRSVIVSEVETAMALPKTLQVQTELMPFGGATISMYAVYGHGEVDHKIVFGATPADEVKKRVWCATFLDQDEASAWVQASKVFGRAMRGAVVAQQGVPDGAGTDSGEPAEKPN